MVSSISILDESTDLEARSKQWGQLHSDGQGFVVAVIFVPGPCAFLFIKGLYVVASQVGHWYFS